MRGVDDPPGLNHGRFLAHGLRVADDRRGLVGHHPGVGGQVETGPAPVIANELRAQDDLPGLEQLVGDEHIAHRAEVAGNRRPEPVSGGEFHARSVQRPLRCAPGLVIPCLVLRGGAQGVRQR